MANQGDPRSIKDQIRISGNVVITSISISGMSLSVSGQPVTVSGDVVNVSGQSMFVYLSGGSVSASISGQPVSTSVSGNIVEISGQAMYVYISGGGSSVSGSAVTVSGNVVNISGQPVVTSISGDAVVTSISGNVVWGTGTSGQVQVQTTSGSFITVSGTVITSVSGNVVQVSGQAVFVYVSGGSFSADVSGNVVWGYGTSGQMPVFTVSGSWVTISGTFQVSLSGSTITASVSGQPISVVAYPPLTVWQSGTGTLSTYITTSASQFLDHVEYSATSATTLSSVIFINHVTAMGASISLLSVNMATDDVYGSGIQYLVFIPDSAMTLNSGDSMGVQFSNPTSCAFYTQTVLR